MGGVLQPQIIFVAVGPAPTAPCPSCAGGSRAGCRTPGGAFLERLLSIPSSFSLY